MKKKRSYDQIPIIHESAHMLGGQHPGHRIPYPKRPKPNTRDDYMADDTSLLGLGMELRKADYNDMFCKKNNHEKEHCSTWVAKEREFPSQTHDNLA